MRWFAYLSNGDVVGEQDEPGDISTWRLLMARCEREGLCLINLCLVVNGIPAWCRPNAEGYWHAHGAFTVMAATIDPATGEPVPAGTYKTKLVGWVEGDLLFTIRAHMNGQFTLEPPRPIAGERQIIWAPPLRRGHGGADERLIIQDGQALRESDGVLVRGPEPRIELPKMIMGETD